MVNYQLGKKKQGKIYKVINNVTNDIYVGSTRLTYLSQRWALHKSQFNNKQRKIPLLYDAFLKYGIGNFQIQLIEVVPSDLRTEVQQRENYYIMSLKPTLNTNKACYDKEKEKKTQQVYRDENKEKIKMYQHEWHLQNYELNKEDIKSKVNDWVKKNQEKSTEYHKVYFQTNLKEKLNCECGGKHTKGHLAEHINTKKHQNYLTSKKHNELPQ